MQQLESFIVANGEMGKSKDKVILNYQRKSIIMVLLSSPLNKVLEFRSLLMEINTKANIKTENSMEKGSTFGLMDHAMKGNLLKV
jgi:hypothetical protein